MAGENRLRLVFSFYSLPLFSFPDYDFAILQRKDWEIGSPKQILCQDDELFLRHLALFQVWQPAPLCLVQQGICRPQ